MGLQCGATISSTRRIGPTAGNGVKSLLRDSVYTLRIGIRSDKRELSPMAAIVVFDVGSSSLRCTIYDAEKNHLEVLSHTSTDRRSVEPGGTIWDVSGLVDELERLLDDALIIAAQKMEKKGVVRMTIEALGFSTFAMNLLGVLKKEGNSEVVATVSYASLSEASRNDLDVLRGCVVRAFVLCLIVVDDDAVLSLSLSMVDP
jgi:hypothetical protein